MILREVGLEGRIRFWIDYDENANKTLAMSEDFKAIRVLCDGKIGDPSDLKVWGRLHDLFWDAFGENEKASLKLDQSVEQDWPLKDVVKLLEEYKAALEEGFEIFSEMSDVERREFSELKQSYKRAYDYLCEQRGIEAAESIDALRFWES
jgi:hypothetical protein